MMVAYSEIGDTQFEELIFCLCQELFGVGVQKFSSGPDGGRDAKFVGRAQRFPSESSPWEGTTIIQAKHTVGCNCTFNEPDFFSARTNETVIGREIGRVKNLRDAHELDNYILFANRRLAANAESKIRKHISERCDIPEQSITLCGIEQLDRWIKRFNSVLQLADIDPIESPIFICPDELAEVVTALSDGKGAIARDIETQPICRTSYSSKNVANQLTDEFSNRLLRIYLKETDQIREFLAAPENAEILALYQDAANEIGEKLIVYKKEHHSFEKVWTHIQDTLFLRDPDLKSNKKLTRTVLFYMYWNCDIGEIGNA